MVGQQAEHPLRLKAAFEGADCFGMRMGFLRPLGGGAIGKEHQRTHELITPLHRIAEARLPLVKVQQWLHG